MLAPLALSLASALGNDPAAPTYARDVAPILQRRCQTCHRPGQVGPFPLLTFDDARGRAKMIASVVEQGVMPPWNAHERFDGVFANQRSLTAAEKDTLARWIAAGSPRGKPEEEPAPVKWPEGWKIGKPDVVLEPDGDLMTKTALPAEGFEVPREGVVEYQYFTLKSPFGEDKWIQASELQPGAPDVVHHVLAALQAPNGQLDENGFISTYVPGDSPSVYPPGYAKLLPKGATLLFQVHYTPNGKQRYDKPRLGLILATEPPAFAVQSLAIMNRSFEIPAGASDHEVRATQTFKTDVGLLALMPHMHTRGKDFRILAHFPDGGEQELLSARYDFNWQEMYILPDPLLLPAGTEIECIGHFDNSVANPNNPDPTKPVRWGDQTFEEMMVGFVDTVVPLE